MGLQTPTPHRSRHIAILVLFTISVISLLAYFLKPSHNLPLDTYNPLTYNKEQSRPKDTTDKYAKFLEPVTPLFGDDELNKRLHHNPDSKGLVYTFFNDDKIRRLSLHEQKFHRTMLRKWALLYQSLGFSVIILHYNDAVAHSKMRAMANSRVLFSKNDLINENYLKLLAWSYRMSQQPRATGKGALYVDYTIFPVTSRIEKLKVESPKIKQFQLISDYEFQVMLSDKQHIDELIDALIQKNRDFDIVESPGYGDLFADYSIGVWRKLLHTNNVKVVVDTVPGILDKHIRMWRMAKYSAVNIVDPMALGDHYFIRPILQSIKSVLKCEDSLYPHPTRNFINLFDRDIAPHLPDRPSADSDIETIKTSEKVIHDLIAPHKVPCEQTAWSISITNGLTLEPRTINLITVPHPLSSASVLKSEEKRMVTGTDLSTLKECNVISKQLTESTKSDNRLRYYSIHRGNSIFFPSELLTVECFAHSLSLFLGFDIPAINDQWGMEYDDRSTSYSELSGKSFTISEGELKWKLESVRSLISNYEAPVPFVINQRQSEMRLKQYRDDLKLIKEPEKVADPKIVLQTQHFESRHDPVVEIAEIWNQQDAELWWDVRSVRWIGERLWKLLSEVEASTV
ncbi:CYFA0S16e00342g1_1 [Cyberlindnera fabianii]|uniref:CYFA0S16e00342g1_1 n=1 Tax=Cyberlindnera fabianii TaxID=36022 RepID=A0A061BDB3_CYBFA|nr:CYFA0S16e00342g1_1 [Cyberlindnera fabianii]